VRPEALSRLLAQALSNSPVNFFEMAPERCNGKVPFIVTDIVDELVGCHADQLEGIFRKNGPEQEIVELIGELSRDRISIRTR
jgi:hypothetical protein